MPNSNSSNVTNQQYTLPSGQVGYYSGPASGAPGQQASYSPTAIVTAPAIPAPIVPPPKTVAVVTPDLAQKDLNTKQSTADSLATALQQQTANKLSSAGVQLTGNQSAGQTATTGLGNPQTPQQISQSQQQAQQPPGPTNPNAGTASEILSLLNSGDVKLTQAQIQQIGGLNLPGVTANPDGTYSVDPTAKQAIDTKNNYNASNQNTDVTDTLAAQRTALSQQYDDAYNSWQTAQQQIMNGTFPLTADQQAQVANLQSQFDQLKQVQMQANKNYEGAIRTLGIRSGRSQYAPELAAGQIQASISAGVSKLAEIDTQASSAVAALKQGFLDNDYKMINDSYDRLTQAIDHKNDVLTTMQNDIKSQVDIANAKVQQQAAQLSLDTTKINNLAPVALQAALKLDGSIDFDALQQIADANGMDVNTLYGAVQKEQQLEIKQQQDEAAFASDQLQAAATLQNTKANTAKTYQEIEANKPIDYSQLPAGSGDLVNAFNSAVTGLPAAQTKQAQATFNQLLAQGDTEGAKSYIIRTALAGATADQQNQTIGRSQAIDALDQVQTLLDQAKAKGSNTNLISGNLVNIAQKLGATNDPDLTYISSRIQQELQVYRRAMTGVAFSPQESAQYSKIFPDITNLDSLNSAKISALKDSLDSNNRSSLAFYIGDKNYDSLFGGTAVGGLPSDNVNPKDAQVSGLTVTFPGSGAITFPSQNALDSFLKDNQ